MKREDALLLLIFTSSDIVSIIESSTLSWPLLSTILEHAPSPCGLDDEEQPSEKNSEMLCLKDLEWSSGELATTSDKHLLRSLSTRSSAITISCPKAII